MTGPSTAPSHRPEQAHAAGQAPTPAHAARPDAAAHVDPLVKHLRELRIRHKPTCRYFKDAERTIDDQWRYIVAPRLETLNPDLSHVLEIACGHGRNTARLLELGAARLTAVDIQPHCVEACVARFPAEVRSGRLRLRVNDGLTLPMLEPASISFAYSFDSLVHMEWPVVESYLREIARVLKPAGTAFVHHSNFAALAGQYPLPEGGGRGWASNEGQGSSITPVGSGSPSRVAPGSTSLPKWFDNPHWRSNCAAAQVRDIAPSLGLEIVAQDLIPWGDVPDLDAITLLRKH